MKVSDYYPVFYASDFEGEIKRLTEDLGFEVKHRPNIEMLEYAILENENNRRMDVVRSHFPADSFTDGFLGMRANVDNFEEGVSYFEKLGYSFFGEPHETEKSITGLMTKSGNEYIIVFHHKK